MLTVDSARPTARPRQPDPPSNPSLDYLPPPHPFYALGWHSSIRCHLRRALLHYEQHVVWQGILHVRVPFPLLRHYDHNLCRRHDSARLLPALQRELSLAVESLLYGWGKRFLCVCQCIAVLDQQAEFRELHVWGALCGL